MSLVLRKNFTPAEIRKIDEEYKEWLWELGQNDLNALVEMAMEKVPRKERVLSLSDDTEVIINILDFNPFTEKSYREEIA